MHLSGAFCCRRDEFSHIEDALKGKLLAEYLGGEARITGSNSADQNLLGVSASR